MRNFLERSLTWAFSIITVVFTFVPESVFKHFKFLEKASDEVNIIANRILAFLAVTLLVMIVYALILRFRQSVQIKGRNYNIRIGYGDIFDMDTCKKVIPFDECFTTSVGSAPHQIKPSSVCGQYLAKHPIDNIQTLIDAAYLKPERSRSKYNGQVRYEPGTLVPNGDHLLMAFAKLDEDGLGRMSRDEYLDCLSKLWQEISKHYGQTDVCVPILGSGITRLDDTSLTQQELLDMMIASYKLSAHKIKSPLKLHIVCRKCDGFSLNRIGENI